MKNSLLDNFYTELSSTFSDRNLQDFKCRIRLNASHEIYEGHFPQIPVVPGVCLIQIIKEILMKKLQKELVLQNGDNIKFLAMVNPRETPELELSFTLKIYEKFLDVNAGYTDDSKTYMKFKGRFEIPV